ncbi:MAG: tripartite tricarboxylate transporter TctB family protein [Campylobacteraceae bacterium]|nr:tripartite tricarboxylate transporter TctB family protein [Campylobacteraceae bacterium]
MSKKHIDIILSLFFIILAVLLYRSTATFPKSALFTTAVYIKFLAYLLAITAFVQLIKSFMADAADKVIFAKDPKKFFILMLSLIVYVWIMRHLGFIISTLIFLPVTMRYMGYEKFRKSIIISAGITLFVYVLFVQIFDIQLPEATIIFGASL